MINGGGRRRLSSRLIVDAFEPMLDADRFLLCPLPWLPWLAEEPRALGPGGLTRSVRICLWKRVPVAARESPGISSLTCTVWAC